MIFRTNIHVSLLKKKNISENDNTLEPEIKSKFR